MASEQIPLLAEKNSHRGSQRPNGDGERLESSSNGSTHRDIELSTIAVGPSPTNVGDSASCCTCNCFKGCIQTVLHKVTDTICLLANIFWIVTAAFSSLSDKLVSLYDWFKKNIQNPYIETLSFFFSSSVFHKIVTTPTKLFSAVVGTLFFSFSWTAGFLKEDSWSPKDLLTSPEFWFLTISRMFGLLLVYLTAATLVNLEDKVDKNFDDLKQEMNGKIDDLKQEMNGKFDEIHAKQDETQAKLDETQAKLDATNDKLDSLTALVMKALAEKADSADVMHNSRTNDCAD